MLLRRCDAATPPPCLRHAADACFRAAIFAAADFAADAATQRAFAAAKMLPMLTLIRCHAAALLLTRQRRHARYSAIA